MIGGGGVGIPTAGMVIDELTTDSKIYAIPMSPLLSGAEFLDFMPSTNRIGREYT